MTRTTLSFAVGANDKQVYLTSIASLAVGGLIKVEDEFMRVTSVPSAATLPVGVFRGVNASVVVAHPVSSGAIFGTPDEFAVVADLAKRRDKRAYSVAGALDLPTPGKDAVAILNGTSVLAMTLANPGNDQDGDILYIVGNGKAAHTVTYTAGLGNVGAAADVITFAAGQQQGIALMAVGGFWVQISLVAGAATVAGPGLG